MKPPRDVADARRSALLELAAVCETLIRERYAEWTTRRATDPRAPEPNISTALLREYLARAESAGGLPVPALFKTAQYTAQYSMVRAVLKASVRAGTLERGLGHGARGRQTEMYVPAEIAAAYVLGQCRECLAINKHACDCSQNKAPERFDVGD